MVSMVWQDIVMMIVNIVFSLSLVPQVHHGFKRKRGFITLATSIPTCIGGYVTSFALFTLHLYFSGTAAAFTGTLWLVLLVQRVVYKKA